MEAKAYIIFVAAAFVIFAYTAITSKKNAVARMKRKIREQWGKYSEREYDQKEYDKICYYYLKKAGRLNDDSSIIDDITWNDLDMDSIFMAMNTTWSSAGEEYLYKMLRMPEQSEEKLKENDRLVNFFRDNEEVRNKIQEIFYSMGRTKSISLMEFVDRLYDVEEKSNAKDYILDILLLLSIVSFAFSPVFGIIAFVVMISVNVFTYYSRKAEIESYFICFRYLVYMQECAEKLVKLDIKELSDYNDKLINAGKKLMPVRKGAFLLSSGVNGSASEMVMEYLRMITHVDLIKFNSMLKTVKKSGDDIEEMFSVLGKTEAMIAVASFRESLSYYCIPEFETDSDKTVMDFTDIYHPLISEPVVNSMCEEKSVLITGSNASGKSTFLKTVAINSILAQTIYTCTAKKFRTCFYSIYSSMALRDNLMGQESYYIVEIKSLKRVIDSITDGNKVLCFVDEVLRGTNTIERIAASSKILESMADKGAMCFAATHDVELTHILKKIYANYHFQEEVKEDDIIFNYKLYSGRAVSRNAIKLLGVMGYDKKIVTDAEKAAESFIATGTW